jgi:hypothetical protein
MGELGALFNPGMRHEIEERESKQNSREEEGNARDGDLRIDLASGVAVINIPSRATSGSEDQSDHEPAGKATRTVGDKPATTVTAGRSTHPRAEQRRVTANRKVASKDHSASDRSDTPIGGPEKTATPAPSPAPSSKASRAAR